MKNVNRAIEALEECTFFKLLETCEPSKFCESFLKAYSESFGILRTTFCPNSEPYDEIDVVSVALENNILVCDCLVQLVFQLM